VRFRPWRRPGGIPRLPPGRTRPWAESPQCDSLGWSEPASGGPGHRPRGSRALYGRHQTRISRQRVPALQREVIYSLGLQARGYRLLDLLILKSLKLGPMHGFGISVLIRRMSEEVSRVEQDWGAR